MTEGTKATEGMTASTQRFLELARAKYERGQAEHGGLLTDRDLLADMEDEIIDLWHYEQARSQRALWRAGGPELTPVAIRDASLGRWLVVSRRAGTATMRERAIRFLWGEVQRFRRQQSQGAIRLPWSVA